MIRFLWITLVTLVMTVWTGARIMLAAYVPTRRSGRVLEQAPRTWARAILWASGVRVRIHGAERLDRGAAQILVANHVSWYDVLALAAWLPGRYCFVAKKELETVPIFGRSAAACGHIFIDRKDRASAIESLERAREIMARDRPSLIMFPEGTRSRTGALQPFKKGAFVLAIQTGADLVPALIEGSFEVMRKGSWRIRPGVVDIHLGEPIRIEGYGLDRRDELMSEARASLEGLRKALEPHHS